jgi:hypothetical protein
MFIKESTEINVYEKKSKFGKLTEYTRTKTLTHWGCDNCGIEFTKSRNGVYDITSKSYCKDCILVHGKAKLAGQVGYQARAIKHKKEKAGTLFKKEGYPEIRYGIDYPHRSGFGSIREHQYVMEMHLNRRLKKGEVVHHIDGNKQNNNLENLYLTSVAEHNKLHAESESIIFELYKQGIVKFNKEIGRYELLKVFEYS